MTDGSNPSTSPQTNLAEKVLHVAVIGSGPAGFYTAEELLSTAGITVQVDMLDRLATPWGLVRAGVAPDHPKIKLISRVYERTATHPMFRFFGNVEVGVDVTHAELTRHYHAVVYAVGASLDRRLGIPGEDLPGSHAATDFVGWYNGHPDYADNIFDLSGRRAIVVGNGNVALDVARMLALTPEELAATDTADHALQALAASSVEEILVLGRRGPVQAAFTSVELRELAELADADVSVEPDDVELDEHSAAFLDSNAAPARIRRNVEILRQYAAGHAMRKRRRIILRFLMSPLEIRGSHRVTAVQVVRNEIVLSAKGELTARPTGHTETIEAQIIMRSIGYRGVPVKGVPFDPRRGTIHNAEGRVIDPGTAMPVPGVYAAGWVKRGPSGIIGTNKRCARETVERLLEDAANFRLPEPNGLPDELMTQVADRGTKIVTYDGWKAIDSYERGLGESQGRPRVKLIRRGEMLDHALGGLTKT